MTLKINAWKKNTDFIEFSLRLCYIYFFFNIVEVQISTKHFSINLLVSAQFAKNSWEECTYYIDIKFHVIYFKLLLF